MAKKSKEIRVPKTLGGCADRLLSLRGEKAVLARKIDALEDERKAIEAHLIDTLPMSDAEGVTGRQAKVVIQTKSVGAVKDWTKLYAYISRHKAFELLQKRLSDRAVKDRWDDGKSIPGVEPFNIKKVSVTKK